MAIVELFSQRQKRENNEITDIFQYKKVSLKLKNQLIFILKDLYPSIYNDMYSNHIMDMIADILRREYGVARLVFLKFGESFYQEHEVFAFIYASENYLNIIDVVEICFKISGRNVDLINELNHRFLEDGFGYQFENNKIIRIDSRLIHAEVVKPALVLLSAAEYSGPQQEFLKAHEHYRSGGYKEALNECLKAFESVMNRPRSKLRGITGKAGGLRAFDSEPRLLKEPRASNAVNGASPEESDP
jgi:hypothetical protein